MTKQWENDIQGCLQIQQTNCMQYLDIFSSTLWKHGDSVVGVSNV